jgi:hypothetical protein
MVGDDAAGTNNFKASCVADENANFSDKVDWNITDKLRCSDAIRSSGRHSIRKLHAEPVPRGDERQRRRHEFAKWRATWCTHCRPTVQISRQLLHDGRRLLRPSRQSAWRVWPILAKQSVVCRTSRTCR